MSKLKKRLRSFFEEHTNFLEHVSLGYVIASIITNILSMQEGLTGWLVVAVSLGGVVVAAVAGIVKEAVDYRADKIDVLFTTLGGVLNSVVMMIGAILYSL
jgi:VanZ family protein